MGADYDHLRKILLASTKSQMASRHVLGALSVQISLLENRVQKRLPSEESTDLETIRKMQDVLSNGFGELDQSLESLLAELEAYVND